MTFAITTTMKMGIKITMIAIITIMASTEIKTTNNCCQTAGRRKARISD